MTACPGCGASDGAPVHHVERVPIHSCVPLRSAAAARVAASGRIELVACGTCGLVHNAAFDADRVDYGQDYEETQGFSPHFLGFLDELVDDLAARQDLSDADVLEVGSGKGEFLVRLCARTGARGLGIDPAWRDERRPADAPDHVRFERRALGPDTVDDADLVVCRHTLEHVADVATFLGWLRAAVRPGGRLVVEVPAAERILAEGAFWDVYHEHVTYPTAEVLRDLAARSGLEVLDLQRVYDDQYLVLHARPSASGADAPSPLASGAASGSAPAAGAFHESVRRWGDWFARRAEVGDRVVLWGAGSKAVALVTTLGLDDVVVAATDVNPHKWGTFLPQSAHPVVAPRDLTALAVDVVVAMNPVYVGEILADLADLDLLLPVVPLTPEPPTELR